MTGKKEKERAKKRKMKLKNMLLPMFLSFFIEEEKNWFAISIEKNSDRQV